MSLSWLVMRTRPYQRTVQDARATLSGQKKRARACTALHTCTCDTATLLLCAASDSCARRNKQKNHVRNAYAIAALCAQCDARARMQRLQRRRFAGSRCN